jgi:hypothetical protein
MKVTCAILVSMLSAIVFADSDCVPLDESDYSLILNSIAYPNSEGSRNNANRIGNFLLVNNSEKRLELFAEEAKGNIIKPGRLAGFEILTSSDLNSSKSWLPLDLELGTFTKSKLKIEILTEGKLQLNMDIPEVPKFYDSESLLRLKLKDVNGSFCIISKPFKLEGGQKYQSD